MMQLCMVFSRTYASRVALNRRKYYLLNLYDSENPWKPGYVVQQSSATWSKIDRQVIFEEIETEILTTFRKAEQQYAARRLALLGRGWTIFEPNEPVRSPPLHLRSSVSRAVKPGQCGGQK